jgi:hypothetical protein
MKTIHDRITITINTTACAKAVEILHTQGIESAEFWLNTQKINQIYDELEEQYLRTRKIVYIN